MSIYTYIVEKDNSQNSGLDSLKTSTGTICENRYSQRFQRKLSVSIRNIKSDKQIEAESTNVSRSGIGICLNKKLFTGQRVELWIHLSDGLKPVHRFGRLIWLKKIGRSRYIGGIKFESGLCALSQA